MVEFSRGETCTWHHKVTVEYSKDMVGYTYNNREIVKCTQDGTQAGWKIDSWNIYLAEYVDTVDFTFGGISRRSGICTRWKTDKMEHEHSRM